MRRPSQICFAAVLIAFGYVLGITSTLSPQKLIAQADENAAEDQTAEPSESTLEDLQAAYQALKKASQSLTNDELYTSATQGVNGFAVSAGGVNAIADLEAGRGVDPETFAGLYAGMATDEIVEFLQKDDQGRLTYKGKVIRMYPISRLKQMFAMRIKYSGEDAGTGLGIP